MSIYGMPIQEELDLPEPPPRYRTLEEIADYLGVTDPEVFEEAHIKIKGKPNFVKALNDYCDYQTSGTLPEYVKEFIENVGRTA